MSGEYTDAVILEDMTEVRATEDLSFSSLEIQGRVKFTLGAGVDLSLPAELLQSPVDQVDVVAMGEEVWGRVYIGPGNTVLTKFHLQDGTIGFNIENADRVQLNNCVIQNIAFHGIQASVSDSVFVENITINECGQYGIDLENEVNHFELNGSRISNCDQAVRLVQFCALIARDCTFSNCISRAIYSHLEYNLQIEHCRFVDNTVHIWIQNARNVNLFYNDLLDASDFPLNVFRNNYHVVNMSNNSILPNSAGFYINMGPGGVDATNNYWYSTDTTAIHEGMFDALVTSGERGIVSFTPLLTEKPIGVGPR